MATESKRLINRTNCCRYQLSSIRPGNCKQLSLEQRLQGFNSRFSGRKRRLTGFNLTSIYLDHAGATVTLLAVDGDLDPGSSSNNRQLLPNDGTWDRFAVDGDIVVVLGAIAETSVFCLAETIVVLEGIVEPTI
mmetsp:Transcript_14437/g.23876  ORF Transcript_14437/g.23876 Transcript_14437/m.23876 type:complete len:134 (-) Transcript_14437:212-613(-)